MSLARPPPRPELATAVHRMVSAQEWDWVREHGNPLGLGPVLRVDTSRPVSDREVARIAVEIATHQR